MHCFVNFVLLLLLLLILSGAHKHANAYSTIAYIQAYRRGIQADRRLLALMNNTIRMKVSFQWNAYSLEFAVSFCCVQMCFSDCQ